MIALLLACASDDGAADRAAFLLDDCASIRDDRLRDDCLVHAVATDAARADALCPRVTSPALRDECRFVAIDARALTGHEAASACLAAGRYTEPCHANAISREVSRLPPLPEAELRVAVAAILAVYHRPARDVDALVRRRLAAVGDGRTPRSP